MEEDLFMHILLILLKLLFLLLTLILPLLLNLILPLSFGWVRENLHQEKESLGIKEAESCGKREPLMKY